MAVTRNKQVLKINSTRQDRILATQKAQKIDKIIDLAFWVSMAAILWLSVILVNFQIFKAFN